LSERLGPMEAGLSVFDDTGSNEQRAATRHGIMRMLASVRKF
jgi:hypothetical protein